MELTLNAARALRDGGIDAMAALDQMLIQTLKYLPATQHADIKLVTGRLMGAVAKETIEKAITAFPELNPDDETWISVAISKGLERSSVP
ncbi:hypothetical protein M2262_001846 [Pseudomonas sp. BIGb0408]|uniref:Uncharacterized protein n=1 Tax=Phytopseudomonas flavescens TaxID=29435 RepID=A0A7Y9XLK6_9GAMM|nr:MULTISPECIES: hypothetical protein [Pseudomonas]MCW2291796.1 hypothetical protein [Pseudomonas sp. BIGb0408]NYH73633.1 hypothetical protein [Pseudomonas flavescens]